jgi:carboxylate-amine ligase
MSDTAATTDTDGRLVAGLWRALVRTLVDEAESGIPPPRLRGELFDAARWRAARYGVEGTLVDLGAMRTAPAREVVDGLLTHVRPALEEEDDWDEVHALVERVMADGTGAARQRAALARRGRMEDVMALLLA